MTRLAEAPAPARAVHTATVCHLIDRLERGGAQTRLLNDLRRLARTRFRHVVVAGYGPAAEPLAAAGAEVILWPRLAWWDLRAMRRLARLLCERSVDIVHSQLFDADQAGRLAGAWARVRWLISTAQSSIYEPDASGLYSPWRRAVDRCATRPARVRLIAVSECVKASLTRRLGVPASRIRVIPNHVEPADFDGIGSAQADGLRDVLGAGAGELLILLVARLHPAKGHAVALQALARMRRPARLVCVGDGPMRQPLERLAVDAGIGGRVAWLGERDDVPALLAAADAFILPSRSEGLPLTLLEAMAARRACVASDIGPVREVFGSGAGLTVPVNDSAALAAALDTLADAPTLRQQLGAAARARVEARFSAEVNVRKLEDFYDELLTEPGCTAD